MKLNLREPSFFIGHRGSVPLCPRLNCVRTQRTASESYARRLHKMAILCHSLINIKVENLSGHRGSVPLCPLKRFLRSHLRILKKVLF